MGMTAANITIAARNNLREAVASVWTADEMTYWLAQVVREIARKVGLDKRANLPFVQYTNEVTLGSLAYIDLQRIEYLGVERNVDLYNSVLTLDLNTVPTITSGTLTGTVTWVPSGHAVSGSGTLFTTELKEGYFIQVGKVADAAYKWYTVAEIVSDTSLVLKESFEEATTADTVSLTKYRDSYGCATVYYTGEYSVSTSSDMPARYDEVAILGLVAHAATNYAANYAQLKMTAVTTALSSAIIATGKVATRVAQAVNDITEHRTDLVIDISSADAVFADAETALDRIGTDLATAVTKVDAINRGGKIATEYIDMAKTSVQEAEQRITKMRGYLEKAKTSADFLEIAKSEIASAAGYMNESQENMRQAEQTINSAQLISSYKGWADRKWQEYQFALNGISKVTTKSYMQSRS